MKLSAALPVVINMQRCSQLLMKGGNSPLGLKQEESARERALCQLTECFRFVKVIMREKHNYQGKGCTEIQ